MLELSYDKKISLKKEQKESTSNKNKILIEPNGLNLWVFTLFSNKGQLMMNVPTIENTFI